MDSLVDVDLKPRIERSALPLGFSSKLLTPTLQVYILHLPSLLTQKVLTESFGPNLQMCVLTKTTNRVKTVA